MTSRRTERVAALLRQSIAAVILREIKDPRISTVTVTDVNVSPDLRHADVYYRVLDAETGREGAQDALDRASGFIQRVVGRELQLRYTPELRFCFDPALERVARVEELLSGRGIEGLDDSEDWTSLHARRSTRR